MKKILLSFLAVVGMAVTANAEKAILIFAKNENPDPQITNVVKFDDETFTAPQVITIPGVGEVTLKGEGGCVYQTRNFLQLKGSVGSAIVVTPANGVTIEKMTLNCPTWKYGSDVTTNNGTYTQTTSADTKSYWVGPTTTAVTFDCPGTSQKQTRFQYIIFEYTGTPTGIATVTVDGSGRVQYFDMQGNAVKEPVKGQPVIKKQGAKATKVIVK